MFAVSTLGLAGVLYLAYASFFVLKAVCLLCVGTYAAIIALFLISGAAARYPMTTSSRSRLARHAHAGSHARRARRRCSCFVGAAVLAVVVFPGRADFGVRRRYRRAHRRPRHSGRATRCGAAAAEPDRSSSSSTSRRSRACRSSRRRQRRRRSSIVKFNDYQCPPCGQTFREYKPILAKLQQQYPGKIAFVTRDFPLDPECNSLGGAHQAACEAAVAVRLAREKGKAEAMEDWLFANQPSLTPATVRQGAATVGGVTDFDARYPKTLELVRGDIAQGQQLDVRGTPTFFMNGIRLPNLRGEFFEAAVEWELRQRSQAAQLAWPRSKPKISPRTTSSDSGGRSRTARSIA